jgi:hypothetical protein
MESRYTTLVGSVVHTLAVDVLYTPQSVQDAKLDLADSCSILAGKKGFAKCSVLGLPHLNREGVNDTCRHTVNDSCVVQGEVTR